MKVLVTGRGGAGSWIVRGEQLGAQIGATVRPLAETADGFDLTIVVKRTPPQVMQALRGGAGSGTSSMRTRSPSRTDGSAARRSPGCSAGSAS